MEAQLQVILVGVIATIVLDLWALVVKHVFHGPTTNWAMVGRWVVHLGRGTVVHRSIGDSDPVANELAIGWTFHYLIGVVYSYMYAYVVTFTGVSLSLTSAITFGLVTVVAAWFMLQPGLGVGVLARLAPRPWLLRALNLTAHFFFGCGLYIGWWLLG